MRSKKLMITAVMLCVSLVLLAGASFAWLTISTNPEISGFQVSLYTDIALLVSPDNTENSYEQAIDISELFKDLAPLKPVSTVDGINWYLPQYNSGGKLEKPEKFIHDVIGDTDGEQHDNVYYSDSMTEKEKFLAGNKGYYVWADFWLMTEEEGGVDVTLSIPVGLQESWETGDGSSYSDKYGNKYGSYVLAMYETEEDEDGKETVAYLDRNVQSAIRIGFLIEDEANRFVIYEPNADQRSEAVDKPLLESDYVHGFTLKEDTDENDEKIYPNYKKDMYIPTSPIGPGAGNKGVVSQIDPSKLIIQQASTWDDDALLAKLQAIANPDPLATLTGSAFEKVGSAEIESFGKFVKNNETLLNSIEETSEGMAKFTDDNLDGASQTRILSLEKDVPKKVRMFIWIEGQDVDCWNDISGGSFVVNLEFAATSKQ